MSCFSLLRTLLQDRHGVVGWLDIDEEVSHGANETRGGGAVVHNAAGSVSPHNEVHKLESEDQGQSSRQHAFYLTGGLLVCVRVRRVY